MEQLKAPTIRELQILELISLEHSAKEIASILFISRHTVIAHKKNLLLKLRSRNAAGLVRKGFELGYLSYQMSENKTKSINSPLKSVG